MKRMLLTLILASLAFLCMAQTPAHPDWIEFERTTPTTGIIRWSAEPSANVDYYYLGLFPTTDIKFAPSYCDPNWNVPGGWKWEMTEEAPGIFIKNVGALNPVLDYYAYVAAVNTNAGWTWGAFSSWESVPPTLPVSLSSFNAILTAQNYVQLNWITESETSMLGFRVYRSDSELLEDAYLITPVLVGATNTSTTQHYSVTDEEVEAGNTYYYWLEACEMNGSNFFGPQMLTLGTTDNPSLPELNILSNAYPNPFRNSTNLDITVKAGDQVKVSIYNVSGQVVNSYTYNPGNHTLNWDGRNSLGERCASGIFFVRMSSSQGLITRKLVLVK